MDSSSEDEEEELELLELLLLPDALPEAILAEPKTQANEAATANNVSIIIVAVHAVAKIAEMCGELNPASLQDKASKPNCNGLYGDRAPRGTRQSSLHSRFLTTYRNKGKTGWEVPA